MRKFKQREGKTADIFTLKSCQLFGNKARPLMTLQSFLTVEVVRVRDKKKTKLNLTQANG